MELDDVDDVYHIEKTAHIAPWSRGIINDCIIVGYGCFVLLFEQQIVAFAIMRMAVDECHILNICVTPERQHQGFGKQLLHYIMQVAEKNCRTMVLEVRKSNFAAINLYQNAGFKQIGYRRDYYPGPNGREDAIIYGFEIKQ